MATPKPRIYVLIMAGGSGKRFWPRSRKKRPKQLLPIAADKPMVRVSVERLFPLLPPERILISCGRELEASLKEMLPEIPEENFVVEPVGRDTAPCIGLGLHYVKRLAQGSEEDIVVAVLPADHSIRRPAAFRRALKKAARAALMTDRVVTIGIKPDRPSTEYGYLRPGRELKKVPGVLELKKFVEKPDRKTAQRYLKQGYLWNAGMFIFKLPVMMKAYKKHLPDMAEGLGQIGKAIGTSREGRVKDRVFPKLQKISIDYGIMEKLGDAAVVPADLGWSDVGGWDALYRLSGGDGKKNVIKASGSAVESFGNYVESGKFVALVGVEDLVVVDTEDALLVMRRDKEGSLKKLVEELEAKGESELV